MNTTSPPVPDAISYSANFDKGAAHPGWPWFQTYTGKQFYPQKPNPDDIDIRDIARGLSHTVRFNGHVSWPYSVAQHSILVAQTVKATSGRTTKALRLRALMHDAAEAYIGDLIRPIKVNAPWFRELEANVMRAICERFSLEEQEAPEIKTADLILLATERRDVVPVQLVWTSLDGIEALAKPIQRITPATAEKRFLAAFKRFGGKA